MMQMLQRLQTKRLVQFVVIVFMLLTGVACAGSGQGRSSSDSDDPDVITQQEIQEAGTTTDAYSLLQRLNPAWLRKRGRSSVSGPGSVLVYVDGTRYGSPSSLRDIQVTNVSSIEFLNAGEATTRYGTGHSDGVILVHMKGGQ